MAIENSDLLAIYQTTSGEVRKATVGALLAGVAPAPVPDATEDTKGILEIATQSEVDTGVDDERAVTPLKLKTVIDALPAPVAPPVTSLVAGSGIALDPVTGLGDVEISVIAAGSWEDDGSGNLYPLDLDNSVGIGTVTPSSELEVVGDITAVNLTLSADITATGEVTAAKVSTTVFNLEDLPELS